MRPSFVAAFCRVEQACPLSYMQSMVHVLTALFALCWIGCNVALWSLKQSHETLFLQSLVMTVIGYPVLYRYVMRRPG
jgi:hypothetical protein